MKCPFMTVRHGFVMPCNKCLHCRINQQRVWVTRMLLEARRKESCFVTLTYDDEYLPENQTLVRPHVTMFLKNYRNHYGPIRFFFTGEYGEKTQRPHYHAILFGHASRIVMKPDGKTFHDPRITRCWPFGYTASKPATQSNMAYVAKYTTKKTLKNTELNGREPEFNRVSKRPPIGVEQFIEFLTSETGSKIVVQRKAIPPVVRINSKFWPVGRTLRNAAHKALGYPILAPYEYEYLDESHDMAEYLRQNYPGKTDAELQDMDAWDMLDYVRNLKTGAEAAISKTERMMKRKQSGKKERFQE